MVGQMLGQGQEESRVPVGTQRGVAPRLPDVRAEGTGTDHPVPNWRKGEAVRRRDAKRLACRLAYLWIMSNIEGGCISEHMGNHGPSEKIEDIIKVEAAMEEIAWELARRGERAP